MNDLLLAKLQKNVNLQDIINTGELKYKSKRRKA